MADTVYHNWFLQMGTKTVNMGASGDTFKLALFTSSKTIQKDDVSYSNTNEITGTGYTEGGFSFTNTNNSMTDVDASDYALFDIAEDAVWTTATITARMAQLYDSTVTNKLVCLFDFGSDKTSTAGTFTVAFNATGIMTIT